MFAVNWQMAAAIATVVSTVAIIASAIVVILQLRQAARERYFSITAHLFEIWQSADFQDDQLYLLHGLPCATWDEFCRLGRGERADRALHRVGGYYDRVGNLVRHRLIYHHDILPTIGGDAIAIWHRIQPVVRELRLRENAVLFENYESLLPDCHECYVPGIAPITAPPPTVSPQPAAAARVIDHRAAPAKLPRNHLVLPETVPEKLPEVGSELVPEFATGPAAGPMLTRAERDAGHAQHRAYDGAPTEAHGEAPPEAHSDAHHEPDDGPDDGVDAAPVAPDLILTDSDGRPRALAEFTASGPTVLVYARGAWCPFCLRQLADYAERYADFRRAGVEVLALSPESPRKSRRLRNGLRLPFTVLSDNRFVAARTFGLMDHEKAGLPTPATLVLDGYRRVRLSTLNQVTKSLFAGDVLDYARALQQLNINGAVRGTAAIPMPAVGTPRAGLLWGRALANMAIGLVSR